MVRTPPPEPEPFQEPDPEILGENSSHTVHTKLLIKEINFLDPTEPQILGEIPSESFEALSLDNNINYRQSPPPQLNSSPYSRSKSNLDQVYVSRLSKQDRENVLPNTNKVKTQSFQKFNLQRQSSCKDVPEKLPKSNNNIKHSVSDAVLSKSSNVSSRNISRKNSFSRPSRNSSVPNVSRIPTSARPVEKPVPIKPIPVIPNAPVDIYVTPVSTKLSPEEKPQDEYVPTAVDKPVGLILDDFLPVSSKQTNFNK